MKINFSYKFFNAKKNYFYYFFILIFLLLGSSRIILKKNDYLNIDYYKLNEQSKIFLSKCPRILIVGNQFRPYIFTSQGIKVFSGFKRLNSISRQVFFEKIILKDKLLPYHHLEFYEKHYPLRLNSYLLNLIGVCHVIIPDKAIPEKMIDENNLRKDFSKKNLELVFNSNKTKLKRINILEFNNVKSSMIVEKNQRSIIKFQDSIIDIANSILINQKNVSNGNIIFTNSNEVLPDKIFLTRNYSYFENPYGFTLLKVHNDVENDFTKEKNSNRYILVKQETFLKTRAYCKSTNKSLRILRVNLIQSLVEAPSICDEIIVKI